MNKEKREYNVDFLPMLDWTHWWPLAVVCFLVWLLSLWHIPQFHSQFYDAKNVIEYKEVTYLY